MALQINAQETLSAMARAAEKLNTTTLAFKIQELRKSHSSDTIQQLQSQAIVELYDAVKQIQEAIWPILLTIPDTGAARQAALAGTSTSSALSPRSASLAPKSSFTR